MNLLDAVGSQDTVLSFVRQASGPVALLAYTLDRGDLVTAPVEARGRGIAVSVGVDHRFSLNGRCRDQEQSLRRLEAEGCTVKLLDGAQSGSFYRKVGRSQGGLGSAHSKLLVAELPSGQFRIIGSCNWTTSSGANLEAGMLVALSPFGSSEVWAMIGGRLSRGTALLPALKDR